MHQKFFAIRPGQCRRPLLTFITAIMFAGICYAQPPHRDTLWGQWPSQDYLNAMLNAPVVTGASPIITIVPNTGALHFDKQLRVKTAIGPRIVYQCLYMNTRDGLVAYLKPNTGVADCDIKPDMPGFYMAVMSLKGNVYTYETQKGKDGALEHWVSTGNTQASPYQFASSTGTAMMHKRSEVKYYCGGKMKACAYKFDNAEPVRYMFGKTFPPDIEISSNKYLGNMGVGYQYTDKGLFIIMEMASRAVDCEITDMQEVNITFNTQPFLVKEDKFQQKGRDDMDKQEANLQREEENIQQSRHCIAEKMASLGFKKEQLRKQREALDKIRNGGNTYQDAQVQAAYMGMMDPLAIVHQGILDTKASICGVEYDIGQHPDDAALPARRNCLQDLLNKLTQGEQQMQAIDRQYASQPAKAKAEKSRIYLQVANSRCD